MPKTKSEYDSNEELWVSYYLDELKDAGFISEWKSQPQEYVLSEPVIYSWLQKLKTKNKMKSSALLQGHKYTPDFTISWNPCACGMFFNTTEGLVNFKNIPFFAHSGTNISIIDVKPAFDMNNMTRLFVINQKWMMEKFGLYVQKIMTMKETKHSKKDSTWSGLFPKTFTPERYFLTDKSGKPRKIRYDAIRLSEYLNKMKGV